MADADKALAGELRPGNAGAGTAADQVAVAEAALAQIPEAHIEDIEILLRVDSAGACHDLLAAHPRLAFGRLHPAGAGTPVTRRRPP